MAALILFEDNKPWGWDVTRATSANGFTARIADGLSFTSHNASGASMGAVSAAALVLALPSDLFFTSAMVRRTSPRSGQVWIPLRLSCWNSC